MMFEYVRLKCFKGLFYVVFPALLVAMQVGVAHAAISNEAVEKAIAKWICFGHFWGQGWSFYNFGKTAPIVIRDVSNKAYVWSDRLSVVPHVKVWANFFSVFSSGGVVMVGHAYGYNVDLYSKAKTPNYMKDRGLVFRGSHSTVMFHIPPRTCQPKIKTETPFKRFMLKLIEASMVQELTMFQETGSQKIIIANFNPSDPETLVLVPSKGYLFYVSLQPSSDPFSDIFLRQGEFPIGEVYGTRRIRELSPLIEKYGIVRYIKLPGH